MNWLIKRAILFLLIINTLLVQKSFGQTFDEIIKFSDHQFEKGNFELAANEYNRALFFGCPLEDQLCLKIANCYVNINKLDQSTIFFDRAYFSSNSDSLKTEAILGKSYVLILDNKFMLALAELMNIDSTSIPDQYARLHFLNGIAYFALNEDILAQESLEKCVSKWGESNDIHVFENEFAKIKHSEKRFNPRKAWIMSLILPGAGQFYSGEIKEGLNSAALLGGLLYLTVSIAMKYSFLESIAVILPWYQRYYSGGANKAERLALEKQQSKRNEYYRDILKRIELDQKVKSIN
jgi:hypothetical protein